MGTNNYDRVANIYEKLSAIIFGKAIHRIQITLIKHIPAHTKILIIGGGTGWILEEIAKIHPNGLAITYVEISKKMIAMAKKHSCAANEVTFINVPLEDFKTDQQFDVIFTAFLFDNFAEKRIQLNFWKLHQLLKSDGLWLFADFYIHKTGVQLWQKILLHSMLLFFRIVSSVEAKTLVPMAPFFQQSEYQALSKYWEFEKFIKGIVYQKSNSESPS